MLSVTQRLIALVLLSLGLADQALADLTLTLKTDASATAVRLTGPWWAWAPDGGPEANYNGDNTWSITFDPAPTADMEYKWVVDGTTENLIQEAADGNCATKIGAGEFNTDETNYANRVWKVGTGAVQDAHQSCDDTTVKTTPAYTGAVDTINFLATAANSGQADPQMQLWDSTEGSLTQIDTTNGVLQMTDFDYRGMINADFKLEDTVDPANRWLIVETEHTGFDPNPLVPTELAVYLIDSSDSDERRARLCQSSVASNTPKKHIYPLSLFDDIFPSNTESTIDQLKFETLIYGRQKVFPGTLSITKLAIVDALTAEELGIASDNLDAHKCPGAVSGAELINSNPPRELSLDDPLQDANGQSTFNNAWDASSDATAETRSQGRAKNDYIVASPHAQLIGDPINGLHGFAFRDICFGATENSCNEKYLRDSLFPIMFDGNNNKIQFDLSGSNEVKFVFESRTNGYNYQTDWVTSGLGREITIPAQQDSDGNYYMFDNIVMYLRYYDKLVTLKNVRLTDVGGLSRVLTASSDITEPAPVPTAAASGVMSIFSDAYTDVAGTNFSPNWNQGTVSSIQSIGENDDILEFDGFDYQGIQFASALDVINYETIRLDVHATETSTIKFTLVCGTTKREHGVELSLNAGWNSFGISLDTWHSKYFDLANIVQFKFFDENPSGKHLAIDNMYFHGTQTRTPWSPVDVTFTLDASALSFSNPITVDETPTLQGQFNGWCGNTCGNEMTDNGDGTWELVISMFPGQWEYKYARGAWVEQETVPANCDTGTLGANRKIDVPGDAATFAVPVHKYDECIDTSGGSAVIVTDFSVASAPDAPNSLTIYACEEPYASGKKLQYYVEGLANDQDFLFAGTPADWGATTATKDLCGTGSISIFNPSDFSLTSTVMAKFITTGGTPFDVTTDSLGDCPSGGFPCEPTGPAPVAKEYNNEDVGNGIKLTVCKTGDDLEYRFDDSAAAAGAKLDFIGYGVVETPHGAINKDGTNYVRIDYSYQGGVPSQLTSAEILWSLDGITDNEILRSSVQDPIAVIDCPSSSSGGGQACTNPVYAEYHYQHLNIPCQHLLDQYSFGEQWLFDDDFTLDDCTVAGGAGVGCGNFEEQIYVDDKSNSVSSDQQIISIAPHFNTDTSQWYSQRYRTKGTSKTIRVGDRLCMHAEMPVVEGLWPALWFMGEEDDATWSWPRVGEIDMAEVGWKYTGRDNLPSDSSTFHYEGNSADNGASFKDSSGSDLLIDLGTESRATPLRQSYCIAMYDEKIVITRQEIDSNGNPLNQEHVSSIDWPTGSEGENYKAKDYFLLLNVAVGGNLGGEIDNTLAYMNDNAGSEVMKVGYIYKQTTKAITFSVDMTQIFANAATPEDTPETVFFVSELHDFLPEPMDESAAVGVYTYTMSVPSSKPNLIYIFSYRTVGGSDLFEILTEADGSLKPCAYENAGFIDRYADLTTSETSFASVYEQCESSSGDDATGSNCPDCICPGLSIYSEAELLQELSERTCGV